GFGFAAEGVVHAHRTFSVTVGSDFVLEDHTLQTYDQRLIRDQLTPEGAVLRPAGTIVNGEAHGATRTFHNVGAYVQGLLTLRDWSAVAGARIDVHNIYG